MARDDEEAVQAARKEPTCYCDHRFESSFPDETHDISRTPKTPNTYETFGAPQVQASEQDDRLFVMFHGYGNDEREMIRIIDAVYAAPAPSDAPAPNVAPRTANTPAFPSYLSFHGTYDRDYMGGAYWYPDGCGAEERRRECSRMGDAVVSLLDSPMFAGRRKILVGFSQGGYMSYRMVLEHPHVFDAAILMSPSFKGEESTDLTGFDSPPVSCSCTARGTARFHLRTSRPRVACSRPPAGSNTASILAWVSHRRRGDRRHPRLPRSLAGSGRTARFRSVRPPRHPTIRHTRHAPVTARNRCRRHASPPSHAEAASDDAEERFGAGPATFVAVARRNVVEHVHVESGQFRAEPTFQPFDGLRDCGLGDAGRGGRGGKAAAARLGAADIFLEIITQPLIRRNARIAGRRCDCGVPAPARTFYGCTGFPNCGYSRPCR